jgi:Transcriptional regulator
MTDEHEIKARILAKAEEMFIAYGITRVTVDEIATGIGISKKTLYKHFASKEQLIKDLVYEKKCKNGSRIDEIINDTSMEFIDKLKKLTSFIGEISKNMRGPMMDDFIKCYPSILAEIKEFRREKAIKQFIRLIEMGIEEGIFRADINKEIVTLIFVTTIHEILVPDVLAALPLSSEQVFKTIIKTVLEGILSEDGRENLMKKENMENG